MRPAAASVALALSLIVGGDARAQETYRWLDAEGRVHFGSEPPPDARSLGRWSPEGDRLKVDPQAAGSPPAKPAERAAPGAAAATPPVETEERLGGRSETDWREQAQRLENRIRELERELEALDESTVAYGGWGRHREGRRVEAVAIRDRRPELESALERAQHELEALEDEARRLGVPPGWLR